MPLVISGAERALTYAPREVTVDDGTSVVHESQGGSLEAVWAGDLGDLYVEVVHLGAGPVGGELVLVVPSQDLVAIGDLYDPDPASVPPAWPVTIDLVLGLVTETGTVSTSHGDLDRDGLEDFHQDLLRRLHG